MSSPSSSEKPVLIQEYVFMWSFLISFVGAVFFSMMSMVNIEPSSILLNKNFVIVFNIIVTISGIISLFVWLNMDIPSLDRALLNPRVVKSNVNN